MARYGAEITTDEPHPWGKYELDLDASNYSAAVGKAARAYMEWYREHKPRKRLRTSRMTVKVWKV